MSLPNHLVLIPDGNRRWAKERHRPAFMGHQAGAEATEKVFEAVLNSGIKNLTFWGASISNVTKREAGEVRFLYELFETYFKKLAKSELLVKHSVRIRILGFWERYFPDSLKKVIHELEEITQGNHERNLTFLLAYNGTDEMLMAINQILATKPDGPIDGEMLKKHLLTADLPAVDLVIRTGSSNEPHNSAGFMMWDTAEAQLIFTDVTWPDFSPHELEKALEDYQNRQRRLGA